MAFVVSPQGYHNRTDAVSQETSANNTSFLVTVAQLILLFSSTLVIHPGRTPEIDAEIEIWTVRLESMSCRPHLIITLITLSYHPILRTEHPPTRHLVLSSLSLGVASHETKRKRHMMNSASVPGWRWWWRVNNRKRLLLFVGLITALEATTSVPLERRPEQPERRVRDRRYPLRRKATSAETVY